MSVISVGGIFDRFKLSKHKVPTGKASLTNAHSNQPNEKKPVAKSSIRTHGVFEKNEPEGVAESSYPQEKNDDFDRIVDDKAGHDAVGHGGEVQRAEKVEINDGVCTVVPARSCTAGENAPENSVTVFKETALDEKMNADLISSAFQMTGLDPDKFLVVPFSSCEADIPVKCHAETTRMPSLVTERVRVTLKNIIETYNKDDDDDEEGKSYDTLSDLKGPLALLIRGLCVSSMVQLGNTRIFPLAPEDGSGISVDEDGTLRVCLFDRVVVTGKAQNRCQQSVQTPEDFSSIVIGYLVSLARLISPTAASAGKDARTIVHALEQELSSQQMERYKAMQVKFFP